MKKRIIVWFAAILMLFFTSAWAKGSQEATGKMGLKKIGQLELKYAKSFSVDYYEQGIKKYKDVEGREVWFVPRGKTIEGGENLNVIETPVKSLVILSTVHATLLRPIGELDKVTGTSVQSDTWKISEIKKGMDDGKIKFVGSKNALDYEMLHALNADAILLTYENMARTPGIISKFNELGLKWIGVSNHQEADPRARLEWIKFAGEITGKEKEANKYYERELAKINAVEEMNKKSANKTTFASAFMSKDIFYVRNAGDYNVKMFEILGIKYIFKDLNPDKNGNTKMNAEEFYKVAEKADFFFYDSVNGSAIKSTPDLIAFAEYLKDLKAVKENMVWGVKPNYYQSADHVADMIEELNKIIHSKPDELTETEYFYLFSKPLPVEKK